MGTTLSKEESLYQQVINGDHDAVKALCRGGASLEWADKQGRTPFILACSRGELFNMAVTLLSLGANINAYKSGEHGGFPLHYAAKRGLDKTVALLLAQGGVAADPLATNDDGQSSLDLARSRGHVSVVRLIEEQLSVFSGMLREVSGFSVLESLAPQLVTNKVWVVVLPSASRLRRTSSFEIAIYESPKLSLWNGVRASSSHPAGLCNVSQPKTLLLTEKVEVEEPNFSSPDPVLHITDTTNRTKYKFLSENKGDKTQLERFYRAFKGNCQTQRVETRRKNEAAASRIQGSPLQELLANPPTVTTDFPANLQASEDELIPEELALTLALDESIRTAVEEGIPLSPTASFFCKNGNYQTSSVSDVDNNRWGIRGPATKWQRKTVQRLLEEERNAATAWGTAHAESSEKPAPPCNTEGMPIRVQGNIADAAKSLDKVDGMCIVCWDAPTEGACIPCGHLAGCMHCLTEIKSHTSGCPVCRCEIERIIKVYAV